ncbi:MAG TPA: hypothetical protein VG125_10850 [Pirellulales bacterium]|jgi:hypothetical protein|nr:hypothetical protein [Pirellulales bacterium]
MSVGPTTFSASLAAASLQTRGSETERVQHDIAAKERQAEGDRKAENAAGIGTAESDEGVGERDADGRRLWERPPKRKDPTDEEPAAADGQLKDPTGQSGSLLDLTG